MSRLFTRSDLERCARLTITHWLSSKNRELAITESVDEITHNGPEYYDARTVRLMLQHVSGINEAAFVDRMFREALAAAQR